MADISLTPGTALLPRIGEALWRRRRPDAARKYGVHDGVRRAV